jgi:tRNA(Ile)-lysidine synthase
MAARLLEHADYDAGFKAAALGEGPLCVAVSGGGDSLALLALLQDRKPPMGLRALIVDHGMRPGSARIAAEAAERALSLGVTAEVISLTWDGRPAPLDHARARAARYRALTQAMRRHGARVLAVAHTQDDQAETALIKWARLGDWRRATGMGVFAAAPDWPFGLGLWLWRPLLGVRRDALRAWLKSRGQPWADDPANDAQRYQRARARALIAAGAIDGPRLASLAKGLRRRQTRQDAAAYQALVDRAHVESDQAWFNPDPMHPGDMRALGALCAAVAGANRAPDPHGLARAVAGRRATVAGVVLRAEAGGFRLSREAAALSGRSGVAPMPPYALQIGVPVLADGRAVITALRPAQSLVADPTLGLAIEENDARRPLQSDHGATVEWLIHAHLRHRLASSDPFLGCKCSEAVQRALGLLS